MFRKSRIVLRGWWSSPWGALGTSAAIAQSSSNEAPRRPRSGDGQGDPHRRGRDVDNPFAPGLFKGAVDGVKGRGRVHHSKAGGGGIAGRKLVVELIDSHLSANDSRNAVITACSQDYAMAQLHLFLSNVDDEVNCKDQAAPRPACPTSPGHGPACRRAVRRWRSP